MKKYVSIFTLSVFFSQMVLASPGHDGGHKSSESVSGTKSQYPIVSVTKATDLISAMPSVEATGKVLPQYTSDIFASRDGIISELRVDLSDSVEKGEIVAVLLPDKDQAQLRAELTVTQTALDLLRQRKEKFENESGELPIMTQIKTAGKNLEATQQENLAEAEKVAAQIKILNSKVAVEAFSRQNGIRDVINVAADFLFRDPSFLERDKISSPSNFRRGGFFSNNRLSQSEIQTLEPEFVQIYQSFRVNPKDTKIHDILNLGNKMRQLAAKANPISDQRDVFEAINERLYEAVDHLAEVLNESLNNQNEIKTLLAEKKRLLISNSQRAIVAENEIEVLENQQSFSLFELESEITQKTAEIKAVKQQLGFGAYVRAPFSGKITKRHLNVGDSVDGDKPIYSLVDDTNKFVRFFVTEPQFPFIEAGKTISFSPSSAPSQKYQATIARISPSIDPDTQTILVEADLEKGTDYSKILAHMNVRVEVPVFTDDEKYIVIPEKAVQLSGSPNGVWVVNKNVEAERININVAYIYNSLAFISEGLTGKEWLITKTPVKLENGLEIDTKTDF
jgi:RND family efflux transporter MFP subunit